MENKISPAASYSHENDAPINVNKAYKENLTFGQRAADWVAQVVGSWMFIIAQTIIIFIWAGLNVYLAAHPYLFIQAWDCYPFVLLNLFLSLEAALSTPIIMMSQNRQAEKDRLTAQSDYQCDMRSERELKVIMDQLVYMEKLQHQISNQGK